MTGNRDDAFKDVGKTLTASRTMRWHFFNKNRCLRNEHCSFAEKMNLVYSLYFIILNCAKISNTLSSSEIASIETYLQQKWRLFNVPLLCRQKSVFQELLQTYPNLQKRICFPDIASGSFPVKKNQPRNKGCTQCECPYRSDRLQLGFNFYPSQLPTKQCLFSNCCKTPWNCTEVIYEIKVLRQKKNNETTDQNIPYPLNQYWRSEKVNITTACQCIT